MNSGSTYSGISVSMSGGEQRSLERGTRCGADRFREGSRAWLKRARDGPCV